MHQWIYSSGCAASSWTSLVISNFNCSFTVLLYSLVRIFPHVDMLKKKKALLQLQLMASMIFMNSNVTTCKLRFENCTTRKKISSKHLFSPIHHYYYYYFREEYVVIYGGNERNRDTYYVKIKTNQPKLNESNSIPLTPIFSNSPNIN